MRYLTQGRSWYGCVRTRPEDKDHNGISLGLAFEVINVFYLHCVFDVFSFVPWKLLIEARNWHFYRLKLSFCCIFCDRALPYYQVCTRPV